MFNMTKNTMGTKLSRKQEQKMQIMGVNRSNWLDCVGISVWLKLPNVQLANYLTVVQIEKDAPAVALALYHRVLYALQQDYDILFLLKKTQKERLCRI